MTREEPWLQRDERVRLRREAQGGFAFHRVHGDLLDLDEEGFEVLRALDQATPLRPLREALGQRGTRVRLPELASFVSSLENGGFVRRVSRDATTLPKDPWSRAPAEPLPILGSLRAPLVAHWALTYRCNLACAFCYADSGPWREAGPGPERRLELVERLARWGVLEVALGGGEPSIVPDLPAVLAAIRAAGMVPNVTTNGQALRPAVLSALAAHAGVVHLSADAPEALDGARGEGAWSRLQATARELHQAGVKTGINLLLTPQHERTLQRVLSGLLSLGIGSITLLRPKGPWAAEHWPGFPGPESLQALAKQVRAFLNTRPPVRLLVDTALRGEWVEAKLLKDPEPDVLGCGGGQRHVALTPEGDVYPCSHQRQSPLRMGNLLQDDPSAVWAGATALRGRRRYMERCHGVGCPCRLDRKIPIPTANLRLNRSSMG